MLSDVISDAVSDLREGIQHYTENFPDIYSAERIAEVSATKINLMLCVKK